MVDWRKVILPRKVMSVLVALSGVGVSAGADAGDKEAHTNATYQADANVLMQNPAFGIGIGAPLVMGVPQSPRPPLPLFLLPPPESPCTGYVVGGHFGEGCAYSHPEGSWTNEPDIWQCQDSFQPPVITFANAFVGPGQSAVATLLSGIAPSETAMACNWTHFVANPAITSQGTNAASAFNATWNWADEIPSAIENSGAAPSFACDGAVCACDAATWTRYEERVYNSLHFVQDGVCEHHQQGNMVCGPEGWSISDIFLFGTNGCAGFLADTLAKAVGLNPTYWCDEAVMSSGQLGGAPYVLNANMVTLASLCGLPGDFGGQLPFACMGLERTLRHHCKLTAPKSISCFGPPSNHDPYQHGTYCEGETNPGGGQDFVTLASDASEPILEKAANRWASVCKEPDDPCNPDQCNLWCQRSAVAPDNHGFCSNSVPDPQCVLHQCACAAADNCGGSGGFCCSGGTACKSPDDVCDLSTGTCVAKDGALCPGQPPGSSGMGGSSGGPSSGGNGAGSSGASGSGSGGTGGSGGASSGGGLGGSGSGGSGSGGSGSGGSGSGGSSDGGNSGGPGGHTTGDPHVFTWGQVRYDFQQVGEYVLANDGAGLLVQVRQAPLPGSRSIATNTAIAAQLGSTRIGLYAGNPAAFKANGADLALSGTVSLSGGASMSATGNDYQFVWPTGDVLEAHAYIDHLDVSVTLATGVNRTLTGLLGTLGSNSFVSRDGSVLKRPIHVADIYHQFGDSWRIANSESLFDYPPGRTTADFSDPNFPYAPFTTASLSATDYSNASQVCTGAGVVDPIVLDACILDWSLTHDSNYTSWGRAEPTPVAAIYSGYYQNDFEAAVTSEWSPTATTLATGTAARAATHFLGPLNDASASLTFAHLPQHDSVTIAFDLYVLGAWGADADAGTPTPTWELDADGQRLQVTSFSNGRAAQAFPGLYPGSSNPASTGATATNALGWAADGGTVADSIYHQQFRFPHTGPTLQFSFSAAGLPPLPSAAWGLDNVEIELESTAAVTTEVVAGPQGSVTLVHGAPGPPATVGCADGRREAFIDLDAYPAIAGCEATWTSSLSMRGAATGLACGDGAGACAAPADACAAGWHVCGATGAVSELRALAPLECQNAGSGVFVSAISHCASQSTSCEYDPTANASYACYPSGWCSESVCCGSLCTALGSCSGGVWTDWTHITPNSSCGSAVAPAVGGVLCCHN